MQVFRTLAVVTLFTAGCFASDSYAGSDRDRSALHKTSEGILAAFARGDIEGILAYHHPAVVKALAYNKFLSGREALRADLTETLGRVRLEWLENHVESMWVQGDTAVEMTSFSIRGTPKSGEQPFVIKGRAMVVYVRYKQSPTGWASVREVVQPGPQ